MSLNHKALRAGLIAAIFSLALSAGSAFAAVPQVMHVLVVVEENHSYSSVIGSSAMPYLNSLAKRYGLATSYYANSHPSIGNYFMLTTGRTITTNDNFTGTVTADNVVRHFQVAGKTWKAYVDSLPSVGYTGGDSFPYLKHHNPFAYLSDVRNSTNERNNMVPFTHFASDVGGNSLPNFSFIVPNAVHDAHSASLGAADAWLRAHIAPFISSPEFQSSVLVILFDESTKSDKAHGGGHVAALVISPFVRASGRNGAFFQHQNTLKLMLQAIGVSSAPGAAASAASMTGFF